MLTSSSCSLASSRRVRSTDSISEKSLVSTAKSMHLLIYCSRILRLLDRGRTSLYKTKWQKQIKLYLSVHLYRVRLSEGLCMLSIALGIGMSNQDLSRYSHWSESENLRSIHVTSRALSQFGRATRSSIFMLASGSIKDTSSMPMPISVSAFRKCWAPQVVHQDFWHQAFLSA
jgi:hypothetical protein